MDYKDIIAGLIHDELGLSKHEIFALIEVPPDNKLGDFAIPCFSFARQLKKSPQNIALELAEKLSKENIKEDHKHFELIRYAGPYINFFINKEFFIKDTLHNIIKEGENFGKTSSKPSTILIESPGPNTNKPLHLGHLRNMLLAQSIYNILKFQDKDVHIVNVINDRGVHICKSMLAYMKYGNSSTPENMGRKSDHFVGDYYVKYSEYEKNNPDAEKEIQDMLIKWENNDHEIRELWKKMNGWAYTGWNITYKALGFNIEKDYYESSTYHQGKEIINEGFKKGIFERDNEGAIIFDTHDASLGKKVLLRSNGTSLYIVQDIYMAKLRNDEWKFDEMIYIVGNEQEYHFKVLFKIFNALGWKFADKCTHFSYGMVELPEGKMKSREGIVVDTDELIDNVKHIAKEELKLRYRDITDEELIKRSEIIALSAIRFFFIKHDPMKNFIFNPKESLSFDGETGPYIEYVNARINSIFKRYKYNNEKRIVDVIKHSDVSLLRSEKEFELAKILNIYPDIINDAATNFKPSIIAYYILSLAQKFNEFYHSCPVIIDDHELMKARLCLIYCVQNVLISGMRLFNIEPIDEM